jgi:hypothetical protein
VKPGVTITLAEREPAEDHAPLAEHHRERVPRAADPLAHRTDGVGEAAGDDVVAGEGADSRGFGVLALDRQLVREPVDLSGVIVVGLGEAECCEPARGSWAQVSERVPAVHDHRPAAVELPCALGGQLLQREADGAGEVASAVVLFGERLDQLRSRSDQALNVAPVD